VADAALSGPPALDRLAVGFARVLRASGLDVPVGSTLLFGEALDAVGCDRRSAVYWAGLTTLVRRPEDVETYDRAFAAWWERAGELSMAPRQELEITLAFDIEGDEPEPESDDGDGPEAPPSVQVRYSRNEVLRHRDFAEYTPAEFAESRRLMADLRVAGALRESRRLRRSRRDAGRPDLRRTVRRAIRAGGEPIDRAYTRHSQRPRRLVLLCDVSGSMETYARALVRFLHTAVVGRSRVEAFAVGTRLTRITRELSSRDPDTAIAAAARRVVDWSGGTRIGECLREFNDEWGVRGMARGAVVVILSDGWDRGEPEVLAEQMARLHRVAYRVIWVNPLKASPDYAPLARGMAAALPYVDEFIEGHSVASLEHLAAVVASDGGPTKRKHA
jgi:uncharacterized protein with von Willebrand factor type A (vWA) domain